MDIRAKFEELLSSKELVDKLALLLSEVPEEFLSEEELDADFEPSLDWLENYIRTTGFDLAVNRLMATGAFSSDEIQVFRGLSCSAASYKSEEDYWAKAPMNMMGTVSYTTSFEVAKQFAGSKGMVISGILDEETIAWEAFLYLHIVYPGCSSIELEVPSFPGMLRYLKIHED